MNRADYNQWAVKYADTFALAGPQYGGMFREWFEVFVGCGYTLDDLAAARGVIATAPPEFPSQHLAAIHAAVRGARSDREQAARLARLADGEVPDGDRGTCARCGDSGQVIAPHPKLVVGGQWTAHPMSGHVTAAVLCPCWAGRRLAEEYECRSPDYRRRYPRMMTLEAYQRVNPAWQSQLARHESVRLAEARAAKAVPGGRTAFDDLLDRLRGRFGLGADGDAFEG